MSYGDDLDSTFSLAIYDCEGKSAQKEPPRVLEMGGPPIRSVRDAFYGAVQLHKESVCGCLAAVPVPLGCRLGFAYCFRMKFDRALRH